MQAEVYTKPNCKYCELAKNLLQDQAIGYTTSDVSNDVEKQILLRRVFDENLPQPTTVPQIWIDGKHIGGYEELKRFLGC